MAGKSVPTVKIVNHRSGLGYVIINLSDFVIGAHQLWDPEKAAKEKQIAERIEIASVAENIVDEIKSSASPSASPSNAPDPVVSESPSASPSPIPVKPPRRMGRPPKKRG